MFEILSSSTSENVLLTETNSESDVFLLVTQKDLLFMSE